ncbi:MAG: SCO1664 family protein [Chloroflexi bacterium]|nr:SCO1664 family protein [Chloroflexota bacterium]MBI3733723.1 SCO1664 family protein [Chloroflexota bacterium]
MSRRRRAPSAEVRSVTIPPAPRRDISRERILALLANGDVDVQGLLPWSTNYTFLISVQDSQLEMIAVYKPCRGERPLWDFPHGTLCKREYAAYRVSEALEWDLVPPTVLRDGPHGLGSVQLFIDCDTDQHYFTLKDVHQNEFRRMAVFDALLNNTDRKGGHCLVDQNGKIWAIDHGVTFHCEPKLRTVIWDFAGQPIPSDILADLVRLGERMDNQDPVIRELTELLAPEEILALRGRLQELIESARFPEPDANWYTVPWPPV